MGGSVSAVQVPVRTAADLLRAADIGDTNIIESILTQPEVVDINARAKDGSTALARVQKFIWQSNSLKFIGS